ncbi:uncharacterized protein LOC105330322 [Rhizophagus clarus]|uniref:Uncharacterized protein LOC105330322 n=1 Tax=Rhizophagus clarus TaxID=94130 RepID=A0A8H3LCG9_9GLOM|nr:uncharacterized protein LOC105330322 [Rhizophagus clarus]
MPTVIVNVEYLSKSVFGWEGLPVDENINVDEFYQDVVICEIRRELWNKNITAYFSLTKTSEKEKIGLKCDVWETAKNYGKYITFKLKDNDYSNESTTKTKNAFELMRIASTLNYLPEFNLPKNSFDQLRIDLCELIKTNRGGWIGKDNANVIGKKFITDLSKLIWYIDSCSFKTIDDRSLEESPYWEPINISQFCPNERMRRCRFIEKLKNAFLAMRKEFIDTVELCIGKVEKARICYIYSTWLEDSSASVNLVTQNIVDRVLLIFELGDPELITDLHEINEGRIFKYDLFWKYALKYLEGIAQESILAVDERRHDIFQYLAVAISIRDFQNQVLKICPLNIPTPSLQWIRLQFWPKNPHIKVACNAHYASALFRYQKEMAILLRENSWLVFMDDKHRCKVGEPGYPVAAVERGRQVIVSKNKTFQVADHDFTKCGIIPSVTMICDIPCTIEESFYKGQVYVGLKDSIFQPSDPLRHMAELYKILKHQDENKPYLLLYTDGGPDHRALFLSNSQVHLLPDPIPTIDKTSYKEFSEIYGTITTEQHRPSLKHQQKDKQTNKMGFSPNAQFAKNVGVVVECYECNSLTCNSPMEIPYYSSGLFEDICFQCGKIPEEGDEESNNQVNIEEGWYYYYCNECYITVDSKKRRNRKVKLQQSKRRRTDA